VFASAEQRIKYVADEKMKLKFRLGSDYDAQSNSDCYASVHQDEDEAENNAAKKLDVGSSNEEGSEDEEDEEEEDLTEEQ